MQPDWFKSYLNEGGDQCAFESNGARISYRHWRNEEKPGLLFVHGHAAHARWWDFVAPAFLHSFNIVAIDLSGSGDSEHRETYSARQFADEIVGCIKAAGLSETIIVGHSFGGSMTRVAAHLYPEAMKAIALIDSNIPTHKGSRQPPPMPKSKTRYYPSLAEGIRRFRLRPPQPKPAEFILEYIATHSLQETDQGYCFKYDSAVFAKMPADEDLPVASEMIQSLSVPVGLIYGTLSRFFPADVVEQLGTIVPDELTLAIEDAHHHVFLDQPEQFISALNDLLVKINRYED